MQISRSTRETAVFVLRWPDIERLVSFIACDLPNVSITASCADKLERQFSDAAELRDFRNSARSAIVELKVVAHDQARSQRISLEFSTDESRNIRFYLNTNESVAARINDFYGDFLV